MSVESTLYRKPTQAELRLLRRLASLAPNLEQGWVDGVRVCALNDGEMGSVVLAPGGVANSERRFGSKASECQFTDADGVEVLVTLNLDQDGCPFEMDIWKTNFAPLLKVPESI
jgi:hypothetical protein